MKKKGNPGLAPNFSKSKKDIAKLISLYDSIILLLSFGTCIVHSYSAMDGCTAISFVKRVKIVFVQVGVVCAAWGHLQELSQRSNNSCICTALCTTTQNLDDNSFDMLYKYDCWAAIPDPIWMTNVPYERKINMLSSTQQFHEFSFRFWEISDWISVSLIFFLLTLYSFTLCTSQTRIDLWSVDLLVNPFLDPYPSRISQREWPWSPLFTSCCLELVWWSPATASSSWMTG